MLMNSRVWGFVSVLLVCLLLTSKESIASPQTVSIGLPAFWNKEATRQQWQPLADYLSASIPTTQFEIQVFSLAEMEQAIADQSIDFIFTNPSLYVYYTYRYGLSSPIATVVNQLEGQDVRQFAGVIFTRADRTDLQQLSDLQGQRLAAVSESSLGAYQMQQYELLQVGIRLPEQADMLFTGLPLPRVVEAVLSGEADAGFVRAGVLEAMQRAGTLEVNSTRLIGAMTFPSFPIPVSTRLYPEWTFAALSDVPDELSRQVASALLSLPWEGAVAQRLEITGFTVPGDYRIIDQLLQELRLPPFDAPLEMTFREVWERWQYHILFALMVIALLLTFSVIGLKRANSDLKRSKQHIQHLAYHDTLTGLPNRSFFLEDLQVLLQQQPALHSHQLILLNLDRFKNINSARGNVFADHLLQSLAKLLIDHTPKSLNPFRIGGDEFALVCTDATCHLPILEELIGTTLELDGEHVNLSFSLGSTRFPSSEQDSIEKILNRAGAALSHAKQQGGSLSVVFEEGMETAASLAFEVEKSLSNAIQQGQLQLYLQPQVNMQGQPIAAEVLVRWQHPEKGLLAPGLFIPIAENSHLIVDLGWWVLEQSCHLLKKIIGMGLTLRLAVNISPRHFRQHDFVPRVQALLLNTGIDPHRLTLEITEGLVIDNLSDIVAKMQALQSMGVQFSIDDFGTGYSSLAYLKRLPIQEIKIDRSFVQDAPQDPDNAALVETILAVADKLRLQVVAEGVETSEQAAFLNARGWMLHQGYLYGRPEPAEDWLQIWQQQALPRTPIH